jgi:Trefoil (P-type) domain
MFIASVVAMMCDYLLSILGVPWCFNDPSVSLGGELCASDIPNSERIDCHPENGATRERCLARGCFWCSATPADGTPWCFMPRQQGYRVSGGIADTAKGYRATLERVNTPSWYGVDINTVLMEVEFHTADRLRIKVRN